jgi:hypothetical protein
MSKPTRTWQTAERRIAQMLGLRKVGNRGTSTPDAVGGHLVAEIKHRRSRGIPQWAMDALQGARQHAGPHRLGVLVVHREGQRYEDSILLMRLGDYADWYVSPMAGATDEELDILTPDWEEGDA